MMPTKRHGWVRKSLQNGKAKVIQRSPFTIQLTYDSQENTQPITLGVDAGYGTMGLRTSGTMSSTEITILVKIQLVKGKPKYFKCIILDFGKKTGLTDLQI
jgi:hypothetical protein